MIGLVHPDGGALLVRTHTLSGEHTAELVTMAGLFRLPQLRQYRSLAPSGAARPLSSVVGPFCGEEGTFCRAELGT